MTVEALLNSHAFGVVSLVDLVTSLEDATGFESVLESGGRASDCDAAPTSAGSASRAQPADPSPIGHRVKPIGIEGGRVRGIPYQLEWRHLDLQNRTYNALVLRRKLPSPASLNGLALSDLLTTKGFGRKCLRDLLVALERATGVPYGESGVDEPRSSPGAGGAEASGLGEVRLEAAVELMKLEQVLGGEVVHARDPRFGDLVSSISPGCSDTAILLEAVASEFEVPAPILKERSRKVQALRTALEAARTLDLPSELDSIIRALCGKKAPIVLRYWGWDGRGGATLQTVGKQFDLSRERIRQITTGAKDLLDRRGLVFAPAARRAAELVHALLPASCSSVHAALVAAGMIPPSFDVGCLGELSARLGRTQTLQLDEQHRCFISTQAGTDVARAVHRQASRLAAKYGAACAEDVCDAIRTESPEPLRPEGVVRLLRGRADLTLFDTEGDWFCRLDHRANPLLSRVRRIVAVAGRARLSEVRRGLARDYYLRSALPPKAVLLKLCELDEALGIESETVIAKDRAACNEALSPAEKVLAEVLLQNEGVMERSQLEARCRANGLGRASFTSALTYSVLIIRYAPQVYGLRGVAIPPGKVEEARPAPQAKAHRVLLESGWTPEGHIRASYRLTSGVITNGMVSIPSQHVSALHGDYRLMRLGSPAGVLRCRGAQAWGLGPLLRRTGAEVGEILCLEFDLKQGEAVASVSAEGPPDN